ncbi:MAG: tetratricopeptide repeat protein, partial [Planctomycetota bacterium]
PVATMSASLSVLFVLVVAGLGAMWAVQSLEQRTRNAELAAQREAEKSRAEAAGHSAFRSHLRALAEARKFDELSAEVGAGISRKRDLARASLLNAFAMRPPGTSEEEYFRTIDPAQIDAQIAALEEAVKPANQARVFSDESDLCYLGMLYHFARHDPDRALASYNQAIEMNGRYVEAWVVRGWLMEQSGRHDEARRHWQTVLELDPTNAAATHNLALNLQAEDPERALALLQKAALLDDTAEMNCAVASQLGAMGRADQAGKAFRAVLARWPGYPGAHYGLALLARERNDGAEAVAQLDDALRANPDHVLARTARGTIRYGQNDMQGAAADFAVVVRLAPDNGDAWLLLAHARRVLGDAPGAIAAYERALPLNDADFDAHFHYSALVMARGDLDLARTHLDRAIAISPGNALAYIARGNVRFRTGDRPGAREDLERATQADPRNFDAWFGLGMVRRMLGDRDGAIAALRTAISVAPPTHFQLPEARQALRELTGE